MSNCFDRRCAPSLHVVPGEEKAPSPGDAHRFMLYAALSEEMRAMSLHLEELAVDLISDDHVAANYHHKLQMFDLLVQRVQESAALLDRLAGGMHPGEAVAGVRLEQVQARLHAAMKTA